MISLEVSTVVPRYLFRASELSKVHLDHRSLVLVASVGRLVDLDIVIELLVGFMLVDPADVCGSFC